MQMKSAGLNDKRFYFHDGIVSLQVGHFSSNKVREEKEKHRADLRTKIFLKKINFHY